ncbi:hypothetical protein GCM10009780_47950 [Actinomadura alba]
MTVRAPDGRHGFVEIRLRRAAPVRALRRPGRVLIHTVRGVGYVLRKPAP